MNSTVLWMFGRLLDFKCPGLSSTLTKLLFQAFQEFFKLVVKLSRFVHIASMAGVE